MSNAPGNEITAAAERLVPGATIEPVQERSWLVSATTADGMFSVRQLDPSLPAARIELIHEFLSQPELQNATLLAGTDRSGTATFDARSWVDGAVLGAAIPGRDWQSLHLPALVETDALGSVAEALGAFHRTGTTTSLAARAPRFKAKEAITAARRSLELNERVLAGEIRKESRARRWLTASRPLLAHAESNLEQAGFLRDEPVVIAHLDLWGSHIVTGPDGASIFLDCAAIGAAPPVVDLAQLLARNGTWSDDRVERVLNGYTVAHPFPPLQRRVLPWLTALDALAVCGHLLVRELDPRRPFAASELRAVQRAADQQLELLHTLGAIFIPPPPRQYRRPGTRKPTSSR
jgi:Ser/Thr protein kinase RdoA (MazF antagonist)